MGTRSSCQTMVCADHSLELKHWILQPIAESTDSCASFLLPSPPPPAVLLNKPSWRHMTPTDSREMRRQNHHASSVNLTWLREEEERKDLSLLPLHTAISWTPSMDIPQTYEWTFPRSERTTGVGGIQARSMTPASTLTMISLIIFISLLADLWSVITETVRGK